MVHKGLTPRDMGMTDPSQTYKLGCTCVPEAPVNSCPLSLQPPVGWDIKMKEVYIYMYIYTQVKVKGSGDKSLVGNVKKYGRSER